MKLTSITPAFSPLGDIPTVPQAVYQNRQKRLQTALEKHNLEAVCLYADREHAANLLWLTGFAPRFEEALLVWVLGRTPVLLLGNENMDYAKSVVQIDLECVLYQDFSLIDQDRSQNTNLGALLARAGLAHGMNCATIGWKTGALELPYFVVQQLAEITDNLPHNATDLLMDAQHGLRSSLEPEMVGLLEYAAGVTGQAVYTALLALKEGISEREVSNHYLAHGLEHACHPMVNFATSIPSGLGSPRNRRVERGGYAQLAFGVLGSLTCRAGRTVGQHDPDADDYLGLLENYLQTVKTWYAALRVGTTGAEVVRQTQAVIAANWHLALNPGHLISYDEWLSSPFTQNGTTLHSGMAIQQDLIPVPHSSPAVINMEDGLLLADAEMQARLEPSLLARCLKRRKQMEALGYELHQDVLPLSDISGMCFPFLLEPSVVARV
jgi:hypothetical protein